MDIKQDHGWRNLTEEEINTVEYSFCYPVHPNLLPDIIRRLDTEISNWSDRCTKLVCMHSELQRENDLIQDKADKLERELEGLFYEFNQRTGEKKND